MAKITPKTKDMHKGVTASGAVSLNCGDLVAVTLEGWPLDSVKDFAQRLGIDPDKYEHLNPGQQRMIIGGMIRKKVRDQDKAHAQDGAATPGDVWLLAEAAPFAPVKEEEAGEAGEAGEAEEAEEAA
jgi:hypothetical protein